MAHISPPLSSEAMSILEQSLLKVPVEAMRKNVRLAAPLAPSEVRASVDRRIDGTRRRAESFVASVLETAGARGSGS